MTITFNDTDTEYQFFVNGVPNPGPTHIRFVSLYSDEILFDIQVDLVTSEGSRYTTIDFTLPAPLGDQHISGIYKYELVQKLFEELVVDSGVVKVIATPGGGTGTEAYISDNEEQRGPVYYRPNY